MISIRRFETGDETTLSSLIRRTLLEVNTSSPQWEIDWLYEHYTPENIAALAIEGHTYVMTEDGRIIGTGSVKQDGPSQAEILAAFLSADCVGRGLGKMLFETLEQDEIAKEADRIWLTASHQALNFYERIGYKYVYGYRGKNADDLIEMEKRR